jgi:orotate phosphoribosyltransferase
MVNRIARMLKENGAVEYGEFILASGAKSSYYLDVKSALANPSVLKAVGEEIAGMASFDLVAGVAVGAVPIAVATSLASGKPYAIIRAREKSHGKAGRIIGKVAGMRVLLVEDVTTSGGSVIWGIEALRFEGALADTVITVVDREAGAQDALAKRGIRLLALSRASEILGDPGSEMQF